MPAHVYEAIIDALEDVELAKMVRERMKDKDKDKAVEVSLDDL